MTVADTTSGLRVLETSHPRNYYFSRADVLAEALLSEAGSSWCEWKGRAQYNGVRGGDRVVHHAAWSLRTA